MGVYIKDILKLNLREINVYVKAYTKKVELQDTLNFVLGKYISVGVNKPKDYPKKPALVGNDNNRKSGSEGMKEAMQTWVSKTNKPK